MVECPFVGGFTRRYPRSQKNSVLHHHLVMVLLKGGESTHLMEKVVEKVV